MATQKLSIVGSTGSIGTQALSLVEDLDIEVVSIAGNQNHKLLEEQALRFRPKYVCAVSKVASDHLKIALAHTDCKVLSGRDGLLEMVSTDDSDTVLTSIVGIAGLEPTAAAIRAGKNIALANKETLVTGGKLIMQLAEKHDVSIIPVDSEHSAIFQCLQDPHATKSMRKLILTASGGPFYGKTREQLETVTVEQTLNHPNWTMGKKVTVDSATLMNKGLEYIEAMWLFGVSPQDIEVVVHRQSIVHSMVSFCDGAVLAQLGVPDMRVPIQYALTWPMRRSSPVPPLTLEQLASLTFAPADAETFRCLAACRRAAETGGTAPCVANAANEEAVAMFLHGDIQFLQIGDAVEHAVQTSTFAKDYSIEDLLSIDREIKAKTREYL